jgi:hypothetical protein
VEDDEEEEEGDLDLFFGATESTDPCNKANFQMSVVMPNAIEGLEDESPIELYVKGSSESITA